MATAVADRQGNKQGVVVLNYLGDVLLKHFVSSGEASGKHLALLNSAGYWLHAPNAADEWGFMFNDASRSLAARYPGSWQRLQAANGQFADEHGLWTYQSVHPYPAGSGAGDIRERGLSLEKVVSHLSNDQLATLTHPAANGKWLFTALLLLLLGAAIYYLQRSQARERQAENAFAPSSTMPWSASPGLRSTAAGSRSTLPCAGSSAIQPANWCKRHGPR